MIKIFFSFFLFLSASVVFSQEICDNGVDDDADGLIDMNDADCDCSGFGGTTTVTSLIPNPSFEDRTCCPDGVSDLHCAVSWVQASNATSDYFNTCGYTGIFNNPDYPLPGGGDGYGGFYSNANWEENIGSCLNSPMLAGQDYQMDLNLAWSTGSQTLTLSIYGTPNCGDLPWNTSTCAIGSGAWMLLGTVTVNFPANQSWQQVSVQFTPPVDIYAVSIGGPCGGQAAGSNYYFVDELTLASTSAFSPGSITESGSWCAGDLMLTADSDTTGGTWQWYQSGIALAGETGSTLDLMSYGAGDYTAVYTLNGDCISMNYTVTLPPYPTADFTFANSCDGGQVTFTDQSTIAAPGGIEFWDWDFGDGNTSTAPSPTHSYSSDGTYTVNLTVTDSNGCTHNTTENITVYPEPQADFEFEIGGVSSASGLTGGCLVDVISLVNNSSVAAPDNIASYNWDFGDGNTSTLQNPPDFTYATEGNYTIQLATTTNNGCQDTLQLPIIVHPSPVADFTVDDNCVSVDPVITNNSAISSGTITNWEWDFGDGNSSTVQDPSHSYASDGTYTIELVAISDMGCTDTTTAATTRFPEPTSDFTATNECEYDPTNLINNSSVNAPDNIAIWAWDFGDGNTSALEDPATHLYASEGNYTIELAVETNNGCQDTFDLTVTIHPKPVAGFTVVDDCVDQQANINNTSSVSSGSIVSWNWEMGDGNSSAAQNPAYTYPTDGFYTIELITITDMGCEDTASQQTTRYPIPQASFTVDDVCVYDQITVNDNSTVNAPGNIDSWDWDLGDGNTGTGAVANHSYASYGTYDIHLVSTSDNGCSDDTIIPVTIHAQPIVDFQTTTVCVNTPPTSFTSNNSSVPGGFIDTYDWEFGDGNTGNGSSIDHSYGASGTFNTTLTITSVFGCENVLTQAVTVYEKPQAMFTSDRTEICSPDNILFTDLSTSATSSIDAWQWDFYGGTGNGNISTPVVSYENNDPDPAYFDVELIVTNGYGCKDTAYSADYITVYPTPKAMFTFNPQNLTEMETATQFNNGSIHAHSYAWDFGDNSPVNGEENPYHIFPTTGPETYEVELIAYNYGQMCSDTAWAIIELDEVILFYVPNIFTPDGDQFNESWKPVFFSGHDPYDFHLMIFNRWGEIIWESYDPNASWNGQYGGGGLVDDGVYIWTLEFKETMSDKRHEHRGHVTVLK